MSKFLNLCEQLNPENSSDPKWELIDFLKSKGIKVSPVRDTDTLYIDTGTKTIVVNMANNEEEAESIEAGYGDYDVNSEVEGLANKAASGLKGAMAGAFGTSAQKAKQAVNKRQNVSKQAVGAYEKKTQKLLQDLKNVK